MGESPDSSTIHRDLDTDAEDASSEVIMTVADLDGKDADDMPKLYDHVDTVLENLFSTPPVPEAQFAISFSYESYRITIQHDGHAKFIRVG